MAKTPYDSIPQRPGHVVTAAVWQKDRGRFRLRQVCYEPKGRPERSEVQPSRRRGVIEAQGSLL